MTKSRIAVWATVVLIAAGALVLIAKVLVPPRTPPVTPQRIARETERLERELTKLQTEIARLRGQTASIGLADTLNLAEKLLNGARAQLDTIRIATDVSDANSRLQRTRRELIARIRRLLKLAAKRLPPQF
ncbi:MAG: hypothetical protein ABIK43_06750 [candidate division WOR-3 bacterium]